MTISLADAVLFAVAVPESKGVPPSAPAIAERLRPFLGVETSKKAANAKVADVLAAAIDEGHVATERATSRSAVRHRLTESGHAAVERHFPKKQTFASWSDFVKKALVPFALARTGTPSDRPLTTWPIMRIAIILSAHDLQVTARQTPAQALDMLCASVVGSPSTNELAIRNALLRKMIAVEPEASASAPASADAEPAASDDDASFARDVLAIARGMTDGRWGDRKVFINHVFRAVHATRADLAGSLAVFKRRLIEANRQRRLTLSQADLIEKMPERDVRESQTMSFGDAYHFLLIEGP